ncbi:hypothetical protein CSC44_5820 [Pseudomonas aeruginosa]|nr:hypothetical protein CSC44_5820 [Pseudomonas aeruginosa]
MRECPADPATAGQWCQFFIRERGFQIHAVQTARTMPLFASWVERGVTAEQMLAAMEIAEAKLGAPPDSPLYYRNFLDELLLERHRMATAPHAEHRHEQTDGRNAEGQAGHRAAKRGLSHRQGPRSAVDRVNAIVAANEAARQAAGTALGEDDRDVRAPLDVEFWRQPEP